MNTCIFHSVNSGLFFWDGTAGLLVDGIHDGPEAGFSPMPQILAEQLSAHTGLFAHLDGVLFTHRHHDHFQRRGLDILLNGCESTPYVYGPGLSDPHPPIRSVSSGLFQITMGDIEILAKEAVHDGAQYREEPHQSYLVRMKDETFFLAGDADLTQEDPTVFRDAYCGEVDAGFLNLYQLASPGGQDFLRGLRPKRIFLEHLPFRSDDVFHLHSLAQQIVRKLPQDLPKAEILSHMSWIDGNSARW